ncbi:MAG TPA: APC family permease [Flavisolibacter sp.]|nr:APC family permease [Flavisolibacter sp.]
MPSAVRKLKTVQLTAVIFLTVSGGPYGLESLLTYAGTDGALLLLLITPLLWDVPTILTVMELNSMMPVTGGYYQWVKKAMGLRWAFYEGWWTWLYTFVDLAIYPFLFVSYAAYLFPEIALYKWPVCIIIIWVSALLNILGIVPVGKVSLTLGAVVIAPFIVMAIYFFVSQHGKIIFPSPGIHNSFSSTGMGLYTILWNFIGWDNATTYAEEVEHPVTSYVKSTTLAFICIFLLYLITIYISGTSGVNISSLESGGFPVLGNFIAGKWLGNLIALGGMASALGLYSAVLLSVSRVPESMATDGLLPKLLTRLHKKFNTPYVSIIACSLVVSMLVFWAFEELLVIDITLYGAALVLEFIALIIFRKNFPGLYRPFKIKLNTIGLYFLFIPPLCIYFIAIWAAFNHSNKTLASLLFAAASILTGEILWQILKRRRKGNIGQSLVNNFT